MQRGDGFCRLDWAVGLLSTARVSGAPESAAEPEPAAQPLQRCAHFQAGPPRKDFLGETAPSRSVRPPFKYAI
jgi:hypothetical protein